MRSRKSAIATAALGVVVLSTVWCESALGGGPALPLTITIDENCHGTASVPNSNPTLPPVTTPLTCLVGQDPFPGGLSNAMIYQFTIEPPLAIGIGTLELTEPGAPGTASDIIRFGAFLPAAPIALDGVGTTIVLVFYSGNSDGVDALADVGFPSLNIAPIVPFTEVGPEGNNGTTYTPTPGQPGFIFGVPVTYVIHSDTAPEPATLALLGIGLAGLRLSRGKRNH